MSHIWTSLAQISYLYFFDIVIDISGGILYTFALEKLDLLRVSLGKPNFCFGEKKISNTAWNVNTPLFK